LTVNRLFYILSGMTSEPRLAPESVLPVLLRPGRGVYGLFVRDALTAAGFNDMPPSGGYVLGLIDGGGARGVPLRDVISDLGVSKQTAGELVDSLVVRGYVERTEDPQDRRRVYLTLTDHGRAASDTVFAAAQDVDARLVAMVGAERVQHTKETLAALLTLRY
jgi:DNA-binding MarR family transcriptional regulator